MGYTHHLRCEVDLRLDDGPPQCNAHDRRILATWRIGNDRFPEEPTIHLSELSFAWALRRRVVEVAVLSNHREKLVAEEAGVVSRAKTQRIALGSQVFLALVPSEIIRAHLVGVIRTGADLVRIGIRYDDALLEEVPWELARDPELGWLALCESVSIVRLGDPGLPTQAIGQLGPIHVRYIDAGGVDPKRRLAEESWPKHEALTPTLTTAGASDRASVFWRSVVAELAPGPNGPNIFHFTGHGNPATNGEDVSLVVSGRGSLDSLGLDRIGKVLEEARVRVAMLQACDAGVDVTWRALGAGLLRWVPAVVSVQGEVETHAADEFSEEVYLRLGLGESLDEAVAAGRRRLRDRGTLLADWWLPVLHTTSSEPIRFAPHPAVQSRMGAPATSHTATRVYHSPGGAVPVGAGGERLWSPPSGVSDADGSLRITADGSHCALLRASGQVVIGCRSGDRVEWQNAFPVEEGTSLLALHIGEYGTRIALLESLDGTREVHVYGDHWSPGERWSQQATAAAWTGAGFTCLDSRGQTFGNERQRPLPLPSEHARFLDVAIGANERLAAWTEGRHLVLCRSMLTASKTEARRRIILDHEPTGVFVSRSGPDVPPRAVFAGVGDELRGWSWDDVA